MTPKIFDQALIATARIACGAGIALITGCQEKTEDSTAPPTSEPTSAEDTSETQITVPEDPTFDECMEAIDAGFNADSFDTTALLDCCLLTTETVGYDDLWQNPDYADLNENCCNLIAEQGEFSSACTPWGPPTPPMMKKTNGNYDSLEQIV